MKVFKFGGASINSLERFKSSADIIGSYKEKLFIIVSAMGKTTNALEAVVQAFTDGRKEDALHLFEEVKRSHQQVVKYLLAVQATACEAKLLDFYTEVEWVLYDKPTQSYDYYYDQIVCVGELLSTTIMHHYLLEKNMNASWVDVRDILRTDDNFRAAIVDWQVTEKNVQEKIQPLFSTHNIIITQGFIGATDENESTTLGREGSDFSAAIFANLMDAESVTIWKDVEAVMNADPDQFENAINITDLSYAEVIEMSYYGAQVIHPKTIKPLQNKKIPLFVKSFLNTQASGTVISGKAVKNLPPIFVIKPDQVLMKLTTSDFSFVEGKPLETLHNILSEAKHLPNIIQNTAISLYCAFDNRPEKIDIIAGEAAAFFEVEIEKDLTLLTIRHYTEKAFDEITSGKEIVLQQQTSNTMQALCRNRIIN